MSIVGGTNLEVNNFFNGDLQVIEDDEYSGVITFYNNVQNFEEFLQEYKRKLDHQFKVCQIELSEISHSYNELLREYDNLIYTSFNPSEKILGKVRYFL